MDIITHYFCTETCLDIFVKTGNMPASSTDANVYVQLFGEYGDSGEILLKQTVSNQKPFQNNSVSLFLCFNLLFFHELENTQ